MDQLRSVLDAIGRDVFYTDVSDELLEDLGIAKEGEEEEEEEDWLYAVSLGLFRADMFC